MKKILCVVLTVFVLVGCSFNPMQSGEDAAATAMAEIDTMSPPSYPTDTPTPVAMPTTTPTPQPITVGNSVGALFMCPGDKPFECESVTLFFSNGGKYAFSAQDFYTLTAEVYLPRIFKVSDDGKYIVVVSTFRDLDEDSVSLVDDSGEIVSQWDMFDTPGSVTGKKVDSIGEIYYDLKINPGGQVLIINVQGNLGTVRFAYYIP
jgi:hypothetical protein